MEPRHHSLFTAHSLTRNSIQFVSHPVGFDFRTSARRTEQQVPFPGWSDSNHTIRLVALAIEQLALITHDRFHGTPFSWIYDLRGAKSFCTQIANRKLSQVNFLPGKVKLTKD